MCKSTIARTKLGRRLQLEATKSQLGYLSCLNKRRKASYINHDAKLPTQLANSVARDSSSTLMPNSSLDVQKHKDQAGQKVATGSNKITCRIRAKKVCDQSQKTQKFRSWGLAETAAGGFRTSHLSAHDACAVRDRSTKSRRESGQGMLTSLIQQYM